MKMKEKKQIQRKQRKNGQSKTIKLKNTRSTNVFSLSTNLIERLDKLKKGSEKTQKNVKKCEKTTKTKLILSRKYLNCHRNRNSLTYHRRNSKNIFHSFSKQKQNRTMKRSDCSTFLPKILCHMQQNSCMEITFCISLTLFKAFLKI